jgi:hypothetical protein
MTPAVLVVASLAVLAILALVLRRPVTEFLAMRGARVVECPETKATAAVRVDAAHAAVSALRGFRDLRLEQCSRWPEKASCGEECLAQIEAAPMGCLVRTRVTNWYVGKTCALCGTSLDATDWTRRKPGVMSPDRLTFEWAEIWPENLNEVLSTHTPVCWNCHVAERFRRENPNLVLDNKFAVRRR